MLMPKKVKYRKQQRGRMRGKAWRGSELSFGDYGLKVMECGYITDRQIEASRIAMTRFIKRGGKIWLRLFPDKPVTKKPAETRMGKGKGAPDHWVAVVRPGKMLFEMEGVTGDRRGSDAPGVEQAAFEDALRHAPRCQGRGSRQVAEKKSMETEKIRNLNDDEFTAGKEGRRAALSPALPDEAGAERGREEAARTAQGHCAHQDDCPRAGAGSARRAAAGPGERKTEKTKKAKPARKEAR